MLRSILLLGNAGFIGFWIFALIQNEPLEWYAWALVYVFLAFFICNFYYILTNKNGQKSSLLGLWLEVRKKKLRNQLNED